MDQPQVAAGEQRYPVEFTATAGEYFRIWIVNMALTIVTLGIYSAWAKVRKRRYFYANTRIDGEGFEYRAKPVAILKGRLLALGALVIFYGAWKFVPLWQVRVGLVVLAVLVVPWLVVRSQAFAAYNTAYRNIRLHFVGTYGRCLRLLVLYGLLTVFTAGIGYAFLKTRMIEFLARNHQFGAARFDVPDLKPAFFNVYAKAIGLGILLLAGLFAGGALIGFAAPVRPEDRGWVMLTSSVVGYVGYLFIFSFLRARIANAAWNKLKARGLRFECAMRARDVFAIYLTNIFAIAFTLGLATPWAVVRTLRYRAQKMAVIVEGGMGQFVQAEAAQVSAAGEEVAEAFEVDFGL